MPNFNTFKTTVIRSVSPAEEKAYEADHTKMKDVLQLLEVDILNVHDPGFEHPGRLKLVTQSGDHLEVSKDHNGSISVNGSLVDGVLSLPDGTEIYTLERFLEEHKDQMNKASKILSAQSKSLRQHNDRNIVHKGIVTVQTAETINGHQSPLPTPFESEMVFHSLGSAHPTSESLSHNVSLDEQSPPATTAGNDVVFESHGETASSSHFPDYIYSEFTDIPTDLYDIQTEITHDITEASSLPQDDIVGVTNFPTTSNNISSVETISSDSLFPHSERNLTSVDAGIPFLEHFSKANKIEHELTTTNITLEREFFPVTEQIVESSSYKDIHDPLEHVAADQRHDEVPFTLLEKNFNIGKVFPMTELGQLSEFEHPSAVANLSIATEGLVQVYEVSTEEYVQIDNEVTTEEPLQVDEIATEESLQVDEIATEELLQVDEIATEEPLQVTVVATEEPWQVDEVATEEPLHINDVTTEEPSQINELITEVSSLVKETITRNPLQINEIATKESVTEFGQFDESIPRTEISIETSVDFVVRTDVPFMMEIKDAFSPTSSDDVSETTSAAHEHLRHDTFDSSVHDLQIDDHLEGVELAINTLGVIPEIPRSIVEGNAFSLMDIWCLAVEGQHYSTIDLKGSRVPKTILSPDIGILDDMKSKHILRALYDGSAKNRALRIEILLDYLVEEPILSSDPMMLFPSALNVTNFGGKILSFQKNPHGFYSVNGIPILDFRTLRDGTEVYTIAALLFDHKPLLEEAFQKLYADGIDNSSILWKCAQKAEKASMATGELFQLVEVFMEDDEEEFQCHVPEIPASLTRDFCSLIDIWKFAVPYNKSEIGPKLPIPKTIISPARYIMRNLIPRDTPHPLYDELPENVELRCKFLKDYLIVEPISHSDPDICTEQGLSTFNMNGNFLQFKNENDSHITINGLAVEKSGMLEDGTWLYVIDGLLFDHQKAVEEAFEKLLGLTRYGFGDFGSPTSSGGEVLPVHRIPYDVDKENATSLIHLWRHAVRNQGSMAVASEARDPRTILSPSQEMVSALIPTDGPNPLYDRSSENANLRSEILLDYIILEKVSPEDLRLSQGNGLIVPTLNGRKVTFFKDLKGDITVNGFKATPKVLSFGTVVYDLDDLLFDHKARIDAALKTLKDRSAAMGSLDVPSLSVTPVQDLFGPVPNIPDVVVETNGSSLHYLWQYALNAQNVPGDATPVTVLYPNDSLLVKLLPPGVLQPLYDDSLEHSTFRTEFLLDYLVQEPVSFEDPKMSLPDGMAVENFNGKELIFRKDSEGSVTVNGVAVKRKEFLNNEIWTYSLLDFLFDHHVRLIEAYDDVYGYTTGLEDVKTIESSFPELVVTDKGGLLDVVVTLPPKLLHEKAVTMYHVWQRALDMQDALEIPRDEKYPRTLLSPPLYKVVTLAPFGIPHPLSDNTNETNIALRRELVNDYALKDLVNPLDKRMDGPDGMTFNNANHKPVKFRKLPEGGVSINNVLVDGIMHVRGYVIYSLKDFLFDHEKRVQEALSTLQIQHERQNLEGIEAVLSSATPPINFEKTGVPVPPIPKIVEGGKLTKLINLWHYALDQQDYLLTRRDERGNEIMGT
ncbi:hypothetical protein SK128_015404 [Halocaridina rubra]|uniref:Uncharacterized protein n=1 Tax=Halocaridina rubra TaxID=373956 RepID=A0AAN8XB60_HALRR